MVRARSVQRHTAHATSAMATSAGTLAPSAPRHGVSCSEVSFGLSGKWGTLDFITAPPLPWGAGIQFHNTVSTSHPVPDEGASYDPIALELQWQRRWQERRTNEPDLKAAASPFYQLMMFPYPSAEGLHVGNLFAFTGADIHGRFQRLQGNTVFEPIGFDAFGIHSENYALKVGVHPMRLIPQNIENFRRQLRRVGLMVDWKHELSTTDPPLLQVDAVDLPAALQARARLQEEGGGQLVPERQDGARERAGRERALRAVRRCGRAAAARAVVLPYHRLRRATARTIWSGSTGPRPPRAPSATGSAAPRARRSRLRSRDRTRCR